MTPRWKKSVYAAIAGVGLFAGAAGVAAAAGGTGSAPTGVVSHLVVDAPSGGDTAGANYAADTPEAGDTADDANEVADAPETGETADANEADGVDCVDGLDAATGAECDGGPAANATDPGGDNEVSDD